MDYETKSKTVEGLEYGGGSFVGGLSVLAYSSGEPHLSGMTAGTAALAFGIGYLLRKYRKKKLGEENL